MGEGKRARGEDELVKRLQSDPIRSDPIRLQFTDVTVASGSQSKCSSLSLNGLYIAAFDGT